MASRVLPTAPRASGVGKNHRGRGARTAAGTFPIKHIHILGNSMLTTSYTYAINGGREGMRQDSELPKKLTLNKLALIGEAEKSP